MLLFPDCWRVVVDFQRMWIYCLDWQSRIGNVPIPLKRREKSIWMLKWRIGTFTTKVKKLLFWGGGGVIVLCPRIYQVFFISVFQIPAVFVHISFPHTIFSNACQTWQLLPILIKIFPFWLLAVLHFLK